jgi:hypothetical protein
MASPKRLLGIALAVGFVAMVASGWAGYSMVNRARGGTGPTGCGGVVRCIPSLPASSVVDALKSRGHQCTPDDLGWGCELTIGDTRYEVDLAVSKGLVSDVLARIAYPGDEPSETDASYLKWLACLPFGDDPATVTAVTDWLSDHVDDEKDATVKIAGYGYELRTAAENTLFLEVRGVTPQ